MDNPFTYSKPVPPSDLIDRGREVELLTSLLRGGHNCRLSAPRRYGKTSLVGKVREQAERGGSATVYVNFYGIISLDDAVARLDRSYRELRGPLARWLTGRLSSISVTAATPVGGVTVGGEGGASASARLYALLDLPRGAFQQTGERVLVFFDEFQEILSTRVALDGAIRSVIEQHGDEAAYLFAGSHPGMMAELFEDRERPFYGQARAVPLGPLAAEDLAAHIGERFDRSDRDVGDALRPLIDTVKGHPQRAMLLAHFVWDRTPRGERADESTFFDALHEVLEELGEAFDRAWSGFDDGERRTMAAVVVSGGQPTRASAREAAEVPRTTVREALSRLRGAGHLVALEGGRWSFVDPLFERWVGDGRREP